MPGGSDLFLPYPATAQWMRRFKVQGREYSLFTLCAEAPSGVAPRELAARLREVLADNEWVIVVSECDLVPPEEVLLSPAMYAVRAMLSGSMISRWLEIEILLYLLGDRNIRRVLPALTGKPGTCLGLICLTAGSPEALSERIQGLLSREGFRVHECGVGWAARYADLLGLKRTEGQDLEEVVARTLRARAALLALEAQRRSRRAAPPA